MLEKLISTVDNIHILQVSQDSTDSVMKICLEMADLNNISSVLTIYLLVSIYAFEINS